MLMSREAEVGRAAGEGGDGVGAGKSGSPLSPSASLRCFSLLAMISVSRGAERERQRERGADVRLGREDLRDALL